MFDCESDKVLIKNVAIRSITLNGDRGDHIILNNHVPLWAKSNRFQVGQKVSVFLNDAIIPLDIIKKIDPFEYLIKEESSGMFTFNQKKMFGKNTCALILESSVEFDETSIKKRSKTEKQTGNFPTDIIEPGDEINILVKPHILDPILASTGGVIVNLKYDGTQLTIIRKDDKSFIFCSRNKILGTEIQTEIKGTQGVETQGTETQGTEINSVSLQPYSTFLNNNRSLIENVEPGMVLQGELTGPKINKNRLGFTCLHFFVFNIKFRGQYLNFDEMKQHCDKMGFEVVEEIRRFAIPPTLDELNDLANATKYGNKEGEGIVVRSLLNSRQSCKIINQNYNDCCYEPTKAATTSNRIKKAAPATVD